MKVLVIGCGRVGSGVALGLGLRGHDVAVVDQDSAALQRLGPGFGGERLHGSGMDRRVLERAGIAVVDALAAVTGSDEVNAVVARVASRLFQVPRVVARLYDPGQAEIYRRLGIHTIAPVTWGIERISELLAHSELHAVSSLGSGDVEIVDAEAPARLIDRPLEELTVPGEISVVAITRQSRTFLPASSSVVLEPGDLLHVAVVPASSGRLETLLGLREGGRQ